MFGKEDIKILNEKIDELSEKIELVLGRQNSQYTDIMMRIKEVEDTIQENSESADDCDVEEIYDDVKETVVEAGKASTSYIQRKFKLGYGRAAQLMDLLEERGVVGPAEGANPRKVLLQAEED